MHIYKYTYPMREGERERDIYIYTYVYLFVLFCNLQRCSFGDICAATPDGSWKNGSDLGILQRYAPGVLVFGAEYCGPCKVEI